MFVRDVNLVKYDIIPDGMYATTKKLDINTWEQNQFCQIIMEILKFCLQ